MSDDPAPPPTKRRVRQSRKQHVRQHILNSCAPDEVMGIQTFMHLNDRWRYWHIRAILRALAREGLLTRVGRGQYRQTAHLHPDETPAPKNFTSTLLDEIRARFRPGDAFSTDDFLHLGPRVQIDSRLNVLHQRGLLNRVDIGHFTPVAADPDDTPAAQRQRVVDAIEERLRAGKPFAATTFRKLAPYPVIRTVLRETHHAGRIRLLDDASYVARTRPSDVRPNGTS